MHYYSIFGAFFCGPLGPKSPALPIFETGAFIVLFAVGYVGFWLIRILICRLATTEVVPQLSKWGGFALGLFRALLATGVVLFGLTIANTPYFKKSIRVSFSGTSLVKIAPAAYSWTWNNLFSKFMPKEKFNKSVLEIK
jgi:hypothetical protein